MLGPVKNFLNNKTVIVASGSPSRQNLIKQIGLHDQVKSIDYRASKAKEFLSQDKYNNPSEYVEKITEIKLQDVEKQLLQDELDEKQPVDILIGADTIVVLNGQIFGKSKTKEEAEDALKQLSGNTHVVYTGVIIKYKDEYHKFVAETVVTFGELTKEQIEIYVASGETEGRAGSYGIQGSGGTFVKSITGEYSTLLGLPLHMFASKLYELAMKENKGTN